MTACESSSTSNGAPVVGPPPPPRPPLPAGMSCSPSPSLKPPSELALRDATPTRAHLFERVFVGPWYRLARSGPVEPFGGNTGSKLWVPREGAWLWALALAAAIWFAAAVLQPLGEALAALGVEAATARRVRLAVFSLLLHVPSFIYVNASTSARSHLVRGIRGSLRDFVVVLLVAPVVGVTAIGFSAGLDTHDEEEALQPAHLLPFLVSYFLGVNFTFAARAGCFARSISPRELVGVTNAAQRWSVYRDMIGKLLLIGTFVYLHLQWCAAQGATIFVRRLTANVALVLLLRSITRTVRERYYLHLHHWFVGLLLAHACVFRVYSPLRFLQLAYHNLAVTFHPSADNTAALNHLLDDLRAQGPSPLDVPLSLFMLGWSLSQFVEGAARWSCMTLWHHRSELEHFEHRNRTESSHRDALEQSLASERAAERLHRLRSRHREGEADEEREEERERGEESEEESEESDGVDEAEEEAEKAEGAGSGTEHRGRSGLEGSGQ